MFRYPKRREFDIGPFKRDSGEHNTLYGLPHDVAFCKNVSFQINDLIRLLSMVIQKRAKRKPFTLIRMVFVMPVV